MRRTMVVIAVTALAGCAKMNPMPPTVPTAAEISALRPAPEAMPSMPAGETCDPESFGTRPAKEKAAVNAAFAAEERMTEIRVVLRAPEAVVRQKVTLAMLACDIPVSKSEGGVIEAEYGEQMGLIGNYTLMTNAVVVALDDSTTLVRLTGRETSKRGRALNPSINTNSISNKNDGRSKSAWLALRNVAKQLRADPALRADLDSSTPLGLVYSR